MKSIGNKIRQLRKDAKYTQTQLADMLSTSQDTVSIWELDKALPDIESLIKLCKIFDVSADYILGLSEF